jgi:hypothetical protein
LDAGIVTSRNDVNLTINRGIAISAEGEGRGEVGKPKLSRVRFRLACQPATGDSQKTPNPSDPVSGYPRSALPHCKLWTKPVTIAFKQYGPIRDPWGSTRIGIVAEPVTIHRSDFGMTYDADTVSDDVIVRISMEATEDKSK